MKSQLHLINIVFLTLSFCGSAAFAESPDAGNIIVGRAFYQCTNSAVQKVVLDRVKEICEGQPACRLDVNPTAIPRPENCDAPPYLIVDWHCSNLPYTGPGYTSAVPDGSTKVLDCTEVEKLNRELEQQEQQMH
jgi:hypothetical protein